MAQHSTGSPVDLAEQYRTARQGVAFFDRTDRGSLVLRGTDRAAYLHGLLTQDIAALRPGEGCYAAYLTPQGRMISDLFVYELGDGMLLTLPKATTATVLAKLEQFVFTEDVRLADVTDAFVDLALVGPSAGAVLGGLLDSAAIDRLSTLPTNGVLRADLHGSPAIVIRASALGEAGYELLVETTMRNTCASAMAAGGAIALDPEAIQTLRIEAGIPKFGVDMDEETIPLEAGIENRAISMTKGCYVGQEVIIRVLHRGHGRVAKRLVGLAMDGTNVPHIPTSVTSATPELHEIGRITSAALSPALGHAIALGYVHRDFTTPGTEVRVGDRSARVVALPFAK